MSKVTASAVPPRVLLYSHRSIYEQEVWRCSFREFEDLLPEIESVDMLAPKPKASYEQRKRLGSRLGRYWSYPATPGIHPTKLEREYDLFFTVIEKPSELLHLKSVPNWKEKCRKSVCFLVEFYELELHLFKSALEVLAHFDQVVFMYVKNERFKQRIRGQGSYLAAGIDALEFCPYPDPPDRVIDVLSIGRRSLKTHQKLLKLAAEKKIFYVYDTINDLHAHDLWHHRLMMRNLTKRARYFLVNPGKIDSPHETGGQLEFGYRYFEGAAPGAILIGDNPRNSEFSKIFHWTDAVVHMPWNSEDIGEIITHLDQQPERVAAARCQNIVQCLRHHDWAHRWESILRLVGMEPLSPLVQRKQRLAQRAETVQESFSKTPEALLTR
jgi:hypothetical protein